MTATHCTKGHPLIPGNTQVLKSGRVRCRTCSRAYSDKWKQSPAGKEWAKNYKKKG